MWQTRCMSSPLPEEITGLLHQWKTGERDALARLATLAYDDLRAIAQNFLRREKAANTLQATSLVHELYLRLARQKDFVPQDRSHFFCMAAMMMRMILVDHSRQKRALKRPDSWARVPLHEEMSWVNAAGEDMLSLNQALDELELLHQRKVRVLELIFFLGCTKEEAAGLLDVGKATVERDVQFAKAWLFRRLSDRKDASHE